MFQHYKADLNVDDKLSVIAPFVCSVCLFGVYRPTLEFFTHMETLKNTDTDSLIHCAMLCGDDCRFFSFNWQTMMCRLHGSYDPSTMTVNGKGWRTHANQSFGG